MIFNVDKFRYLAHAPVTALSWGMRLRGMIGRKFDANLDGMVFPRCNSVHTFFMGQSIDILFLDKEERVVGLHERVAPWRPIISCSKGVTTVELPAGEIAKSQTKMGDQLNLNMEYSVEAIDKRKYGAILYHERGIEVKGQVTKEQ